MAARTSKAKTRATDRAAKDLKYGAGESDPSKLFKAHIDTMVDQYYMLIKLIQRVSALPKGGHLLYPIGPHGAPAQVTRRDIRSLVALYAREIVDMKNWYRVGRKKRTRRTVPPEDFKGVYGSVVVGPALKQYFRTENFGPLDPTNPASGRLIDALPNLQRGWLLRNGIRAMLQ